MAIGPDEPLYPGFDVLIGEGELVEVNPGDELIGWQVENGQLVLNVGSAASQILAQSASAGVSLSNATVLGTVDVREGASLDAFYSTIGKLSVGRTGGPISRIRIFDSALNSLDMVGGIAEIDGTTVGDQAEASGFTLSLSDVLGPSHPPEVIQATIRNSNLFSGLGQSSVVNVTQGASLRLDGVTVESARASGPDAQVHPTDQGVESVNDGIWVTEGARAEISNSTIRTSGRGIYVRSGMLSADGAFVESADSAGMLINRGYNHATATLSDISAVSLTNSKVSGSYAGVRLGWESSLLLDHTRLSSSATPADANGVSTGLWLEGASATAINGTEIRGVTAGVLITGAGGFPGNGPYLESALALNGSSISSRDGPAISVSTGDVSAPQMVTIQIADGSTATGGDGRVISVNGEATVAFNVASSTLSGDVVADGPNAILNVGVSASSLTGRLIGAGAAEFMGSTWKMTGDSQVVSLGLSNGSLLSLGDGTRFNTLTVNGDFEGTGSMLAFQTALGDDASLTDRLIIRGDSSGSTRVSVINAGGVGARTVDGIKIVQVDGRSEGTFALSGRAVGGKYEYFLLKGHQADATDGNWYLRSELPLDPPIDPTEPTVDPTPPTIPLTPVGPGTLTTPLVPVIPLIPGVITPPPAVLRPEVGAYLSAQAGAGNMFEMRRHDRGTSSFGGPDPVGPWVRLHHSQAKSNIAAGQLSVDSDNSSMQIGLSVFESTDQRTKIGVFLGAGTSNNRVASRLTRYRAKSVVEGRAAGVYGTYTNEWGLYIDAWTQLARFKHEVQGDALATARYNTGARAGSVEAGYGFAVPGGARRRLFVEPQLQLSYRALDRMQIKEANGTSVASQDGGGLATRFGARVFGDIDVSGGPSIRPFVALNAMHRSNQNTVLFDSERLAGGAPRRRYEAKVGAQFEFEGRWQAWADAALQRGDDQYRDTAVQAGLSARW